MRTLTLLLGILACGSGFAAATPQGTIDAKAAAAVFSEAHNLCSLDAGHLWGVSLCGPMMFVDPATHEAVANQSTAGSQRDGTVFRFKIPANVGEANTSLSFEGQRWTMILWPLPTDIEKRSVMLMHESYHRIQPTLHLEGSGGLGTNGYLDSESGRIWLRVELHALNAALASQGASRTTALADAISIAVYRRSLWVGSAEEERGLIVNEGLAESSGIDAGLPVDRRIAYAQSDLKMVEDFPSYVRAFPYALGPAYVELLDAREPAWRSRVNNRSDLPLLAAAAYGITVETPAASGAAQIAARYDGDAIASQEHARMKRLEAVRVRYAAEFTNGPVLTLPLNKFNITFNPSDVEQFGTSGSVYHTLTLRDAWGTLHVDGGDALISPDFKSVMVPRGNATALGQGWTLDLAQAYSIVPSSTGKAAMTVEPLAHPSPTSSPR